MDIQSNMHPGTSIILCSDGTTAPASGFANRHQRACVRVVSCRRATEHRSSAVACAVAHFLDTSRLLWKCDPQSASKQPAAAARLANQWDATVSQVRTTLPGKDLNLKHLNYTIKDLTVTASHVVGNFKIVQWIRTWSWSNSILFFKI